jgi:hypothetical protein
MYLEIKTTRDAHRRERDFQHGRELCQLVEERRRSDNLNRAWVKNSINDCLE